MTRTILAATDLSARSDRAVDRALNLGAEMQLPVSILHVRDPAESASIADEPLREAVQSVLPDPNSDCEILTLTGPVPRTIAKAADEHKAVYFSPVTLAPITKPFIPIQKRRQASIM